MDKQFDLLNDKALVVSNDTEPVVVKYKGETIRKLSAIKSTEQGTTEVTYNSEYKKNLLNMSVKGNTEQKTYEGYNLIDLDLVINEMNLGDDSWYKKDGSWYCEELGEYHNIRIFTNDENIVGSLTLLVNQKTDDTSVGSNGSLGLAYIIHYTDGTTYNFDVKTTTDYREQYYTTDNSKTVNYIDFNVIIELPTYIKYIMVNKGVSKPYEPYVGGKPSPSVEYPQPIENSTNVSAELSGANLFDINDLEYVRWATYEVKDNNTVVFTPTSRNSIYRYHLKVEVGKKYTVSVENIVTNYAPQSLLKAIWVGNTTSGDDFEYGKAYVNQPFTFTATSEDLYIKCYICYSKIEGETLTIVKPMVVEGTQVLPYQPYFAPTKVDIPSEVTLADGTVVPLRFAKAGNYADTFIVDKLKSKVIYKQFTKEYQYTGNETFYSGGDNLTDVYRYYAVQPNLTVSMANGYGWCTHLPRIEYGNKQGVVFGQNNGYIYFFLDKTTYPSINSVKSWITEQATIGNPVKIMWVTEIPIEYDLTSTDLGQQLLTLANNTQNATNIINISADVPVSNLNVDFAIWGGRDED